MSASLQIDQVSESPSKVLGCKPLNADDAELDAAIAVMADNAAVGLAKSEVDKLNSIDESSLSWDDLVSHSWDLQHAKDTLHDVAKQAARRACAAGAPLDTFIIEAVSPHVDGAALGAPSNMNGETGPNKLPSPSKLLSEGRDVLHSSELPQGYVQSTINFDYALKELDSARSRPVLAALLDSFGSVGIGRYRITRAVYDAAGRLDYRNCELREFELLPGNDGKQYYVSKIYSGSDEEKEALIKQLISESKRDYKYWLQHYAKTILWRDWSWRNDHSDPLVKDSLPAFTGCMAGAFPRESRDLHETVQQFEIHEKEGKIAFVGLAMCGSIFCPVCGPRIAFKRFLEFSQIFYRFMEQGYSAVFVTRTIRHDRYDSFAKIRTGFKAATSLYRKSRDYNALRKFNSGQAIHWITSYELTCDDPGYRFSKWTGWHFHTHEVIFFKKADGKRLLKKDLDEISKRLKSAWAKAVEKVGMVCDVEKGMDVQGAHAFMRSFGKKCTNRQFMSVLDRLEKAKEAENGGKKLTEKQKKLIEMCRAMVRYLTKGLAMEVSNGPIKSARYGKFGGRRIGIGQLLERAVLGDKIAKSQWCSAYWESQGMHWYDTSRGLRKLCGIEKEAETDEDLLRGKAGKQILAFGIGGKKNLEEGYDHSRPDFDEDAWRPILNQGRLGQLRKAAESALKKGGWGLVRKTVRAVCDAAADGYDVLTYKVFSDDCRGHADSEFVSDCGKAIVSPIKSGIPVRIEWEDCRDDSSCPFDEKKVLEEIKIDRNLDPVFKTRIESIIDELVKLDSRLDRLAFRAMKPSGIQVRDGNFVEDLHAPFMREAAELYLTMESLLDVAVSEREKAGYDMSDPGVIQSWARRFVPTWYEAGEWSAEFQACVDRIRCSRVGGDVSDAEGWSSDFQVCG